MARRGVEVERLGRSGGKDISGLSISGDVLKGGIFRRITHSMADGYLVQHVHRQCVPEVKPRWATASGDIVWIRKRLSFDTEPPRRTLVDRLGVGVSNLIGQTVAIPLLHFDLKSVVAASADAAIADGWPNIRNWR